MIRYYILDGTTIKEASSVMEWAKWFERASKTRERIVQQHYIADVKVSTVFLGLDHQWGEGPPILFETMVFGYDVLEDFQERYATWGEAKVGHEAVRLMVVGTLREAVQCCDSCGGRWRARYRRYKKPQWHCEDCDRRRRFRNDEVREVMALKPNEWYQKQEAKRKRFLEDWKNNEMGLKETLQALSVLKA